MRVSARGPSLQRRPRTGPVLQDGGDCGRAKPFANGLVQLAALERDPVERVRRRRRLPVEEPGQNLRSRGGTKTSKGGRAGRSRRIKDEQGGQGRARQANQRRAGGHSRAQANQRRAGGQGRAQQSWRVNNDGTAWRHVASFVPPSTAERSRACCGPAASLPFQGIRPDRKFPKRSSSPAASSGSGVLSERMWRTSVSPRSICPDRSMQPHPVSARNGVVPMFSKPMFAPQRGGPGGCHDAHEVSSNDRGTGLYAYPCGR